MLSYQFVACYKGIRFYFSNHMHLVIYGQTLWICIYNNQLNGYVKQQPELQFKELILTWMMSKEHYTASEEASLRISSLQLQLHRAGREANQLCILKSQVSSQGAICNSLHLQKRSHGMIQEKISHEIHNYYKKVQTVRMNLIQGAKQTSAYTT